jgi:hypothetical protein
MALRLALPHFSPSKDRLRSDIARFADELGQNSFAIAGRLRDDRVRGVPKSTHDCVVARYLNALLSADFRVLTVEVTRDWIVVRRAGRQGVQVRLPVSLQEFISLFDAGYFPELIDPGVVLEDKMSEVDISVELPDDLSCKTEVMPLALGGSDQPSLPSNPSGPQN